MKLMNRAIFFGLNIQTYYFWKESVFLIVISFYYKTFYNYAPYNRLIKRSPSKRNKTDSDSHQQQILKSTS